MLELCFDQLEELCVCIVPHCLIALRFVMIDLEGVADDFTCFGQILDFTGGNCLNSDVADCSCFHRTCVDRATACICRQLAKRSFLGAAANALANGPRYNASFGKAWEQILFNHFHDILPGSGVIDTREYAMGQFQRAMAAIQTNANLTKYTLYKNGVLKKCQKFGV